jgi:hypothetical protein
MEKMNKYQIAFNDEEIVLLSAILKIGADVLRGPGNIDKEFEGAALEMLNQIHHKLEPFLQEIQEKRKNK